MFSNKSSFSNSDGRDSRQNSQMAGKTEPTGMGDSLTVAQYQVWQQADFCSHRRGMPALLEKTGNPEHKQKRWDGALLQPAVTANRESSELLQQPAKRHLKCPSLHLRLRRTELLTVGFR